jgi:N-methylhydantoinase B/oxoprolinase/acetone carboxylase alpha subunit
MTMLIEATENTGPVIIWRKELCPDSGGVGKYWSGLGQFMVVGAVEGYEFDFQAMFDRVDHPGRGRQGGKNGATTEIAQDDGSRWGAKVNSSFRQVGRSCSRSLAVLDTVTPKTEIATSSIVICSAVTSQLKPLREIMVWWSGNEV